MRSVQRIDSCNVPGTMLAVAAGLLFAGPLCASPLDRLSADFQNSTTSGPDERSTNLAALANGGGGLVTYSKTVPTLGINTLYVTFSAQGDSHSGSALLMNAVINGQLCQPLLGQRKNGGGGPHVQTGWYTLSHLPQSTTGTNCNDGAGGTGDCHDNTIYFSCCAHISAPSSSVKIKLANLPGGGGNTSSYERATIYIDGLVQPRCAPAP
jgi:hypothetical protein